MLVPKKVTMTKQTCCFFTQVGAVRQPHGTRQRLPRPLPPSQTRRDRNPRQHAQQRPQQDHRLDPQSLASS